MDKEEIIRRLKRLAKHAVHVGGEPSYNIILSHDDGIALNKAVRLLKGQEPVEPIFIENPYTHLPVSYCSRCREPIDKYTVGNSYKMIKFCHYCGQEVKWERALQNGKKISKGT